MTDSTDLPTPLAAPSEDDRRSTRTGLVAGAVALLVLGLVVGVALLTLALGNQRDERRKLAATQDRREEALAAARAFAVLVTSYDHTRIAQDVEKVTAGTADSSRCEIGPDGAPVKDTGCFRTEYTRTAGAQFQKLIKDNKATSKGEVRSAGVVSDKDGRMVVLLAVDQTVTNINRPAPRVDRTRMQLTLERVDGKWLVVDVALL